MFITFTGVGPEGALSEVPGFSDPFPLAFDQNSTLIAQKKMNSVNIMMASSAEQLATWCNNMQRMAEQTRLGIPVTIGSDPRHGSTENPGAAIPTSFFSKWASPLGLAATRDSVLVQEFGDIARQEYLAVGLRLALHPMADLATEPRWARVNGTFGEDAFLSAKLTAAYVKGFQGDTLNRNSVACMTKHFSGGGPQADGMDAHFASGKGQAYPGNNFDYHVIPFSKGAIPAHTAQLMTYYGIPEGQSSEEVAFGFNKEIVTGLLRDSLGFDGVVCTDWGIVSDMFVKPASAWGVEELSVKQRVKKVIDAGSDMFGGESIPEVLLELVEEGSISVDRIDASVRRILRDKFVLGLFDDPYVDLKGLDLLANPDFMAKGKASQRKSMVLLKNDNNILPLAADTKIYLEGFTALDADDEAFGVSYGQVVNNPAAAVLRCVQDLKQILPTLTAFGLNPPEL
ncbi:MAG: glycoside hydrolase family 3 N-terminal domain-containing protein, partial [Bacteroidota bacterium]